MHPPHSLDFFSTMGFAMGGFVGRDAPARREAGPRPGLDRPFLALPSFALAARRPRLSGLFGSMLPPGF